MSSNGLYSTPPIGSRPPFATDDDHLYDEKTGESTRRLKQPSPTDPNARTSAYNTYDSYLDESRRDSGAGALGAGMMNDMDDDDDDDNPFDDRHRSMLPPPSPRQQQKPIPLAAPKPGYAAPVSALSINPPSPAASPVGRLPSPSHPRPLMLVNSLNSPKSPRLPSPGGMVPASPHPLPPTITPIQPVFARPSKSADERDIKFANQAILRGEKEGGVLPKRGENGDDFWRRFSMVVKAESSLPAAQKESLWLRKTQNGTTRLTRWVWVIGLLLLVCVAGGIGIGMYINSKNTTPDAPKAIGGSANEKLQTTSSSAASAPVGATTTSFHVSPTFTVARRDDAPLPTDVPLSFVHIPKQPSSLSDDHLVRAVPPSRHRRAHLNRTNDT
ncbi:uncharacterized protein PHACADRAFT_262391 [Phanerochaete carnosa HHB-10118-sp]|uniref:Uncharacterized protein n=1 Tax=Phanerochaete carnosa (strain HHB-10118-sp) TaxID=650164 RepID=K5VYR4_PHACS|nr:uncharacterized protein PHACADRAFT_262391 [Phanerochaete carnosa HHB-10118-sp]EKM51960.1 hypothetical protein PHACADRAFT_262391 [Phanerochaete carnosa HHB-10118-sp]